MAGGHLTDPPLESVYSGVVSLRGLRMVIFLSELNKLSVFQTDIGNAFLEARTTEKVYVIAGGEFGSYKDHIFVIAIEQMKDLKFTLLYLGVPIVDRSIMVGDNKTVVDCATQPHYKLVKRHLMLSYHYVREAMATGNYGYVWLNGKDNPADILSKHWAYGTVWKLLQPLLFWQGDTNDCPSKMTDLTSG